MERTVQTAPPRVLVADDEDAIRVLVCLAVRKAGCAVVARVRKLTTGVTG
jgi:CheY-like chemotaxis protein